MQEYNLIKRSRGMGIAALVLIWPLDAWAQGGEVVWLDFTLPFALVAVAGVAAWWLVRRYGVKWQRGGTLEVVQALQLGARERVLLIRVGDEYLLLGATPGRISLLQHLKQAPRGLDRDTGEASARSE